MELEECGLLKPASDRLERIARDVSGRMGVRLRGGVATTEQFFDGVRIALHWRCDFL